MVHVVIHPYITSLQQEELLYLDFQGDFDSPELADVSNVDIGQLTLTDTAATLFIGHHKLVGKKVKLVKPFAVIHKRKDHMQVCYDVVTILKEKYVFSNRPGLIVQESLRGLKRIGGR